MLPERVWGTTDPTSSSGGSRRLSKANRRSILQRRPTVGGSVASDAGSIGGGGESLSSADRFADDADYDDGNDDEEGGYDMAAGGSYDYNDAPSVTQSADDHSQMSSSQPLTKGLDIDTQHLLKANRIVEKVQIGYVSSYFHVA